MKERTLSFGSLALLLASFGLGGCAREVPPHLYLTWRFNETATSMSVNFHTPTDFYKQVYVHYDDESHGKAPEEYASKNAAELRFSSPTQRQIHTADLRGLEPDTTYHFIISDGSDALTGVNTFRTLPSRPDTTLRFVTGGDMGVDDTVAELNRRAAALDPQFALIGGDVAYANGLPWKYEAWDRWLTMWTENMVRPDGSLIPIVMAIGNHEVRGGWGGSLNDAPFYSHYFSQSADGSSSYFSRHFGGHSAVYVLDTGHAAPIAGEQTEWLKAAMSADKNLPNRFALYHVPLYPSVRSPHDANNVEARENWGPVFDAFELTAGFENHDHALKRTHPLKDGVPDKNGTLYLGDGCWGRAVRGSDPSRPYLAHSENTQHFWLVEASATEVKFKAIDRQGDVRDTASLPHAAAPSSGD